MSKYMSDLIRRETTKPIQCPARPCIPAYQNLFSGEVKYMKTGCKKEINRKKGGEVLV